MNRRVLLEILISPDSHTITFESNTFTILCEHMRYDASRARVDAKHGFLVKDEKEREKKSSKVEVILYICACVQRIMNM